jgi:DNA-directed RNA polymerase subunit RPC12/RpoP
MICFNCDSDKEAAFFQETFPCGHCEEDNLLEYNMCPDCGWMWRSVNGRPLEGSQMHAGDMSDFLSMLGGEPPKLTEEEEEILANVSEHLLKVEKMESGEASMSDYVHKCLQCNSTAVDVNDGQYKCTDCGFEWEIVKYE